MLGLEWLDLNNQKKDKLKQKEFMASFRLESKKGIGKPYQMHYLRESSRFMGGIEDAQNVKLRSGIFFVMNVILKLILLELVENVKKNLVNLHVIIVDQRTLIINQSMK